MIPHYLLQLACENTDIPIEIFHHRGLARERARRGTKNPKALVETGSLWEDPGDPLGFRVIRMRKGQPNEVVDDIWLENGK
jgi:hypothetical protein